MGSELAKLKSAVQARGQRLVRGTNTQLLAGDGLQRPIDRTQAQPEPEALARAHEECDALLLFYRRGLLESDGVRGSIHD